MRTLRKACQHDTLSMFHIHNCSNLLLALVATVSTRDCTIIACAAPQSGGRAVITPRLSRRFNIFCLPEASHGTLSKIFSSIMKGFLTAGVFFYKIKNIEKAAINSIISIYIKIQKDLRPTPAKLHYLFNLRDESKVVQEICICKAVSIQTPELNSS